MRRPPEQVHPERNGERADRGEAPRHGLGREVLRRDRVRASEVVLLLVEEVDQTRQGRTRIQQQSQTVGDRRELFLHELLKGLRGHAQSVGHGRSNPGLELDRRRVETDEVGSEAGDRLIGQDRPEVVDHLLEVAPHREQVLHEGGPEEHEPGQDQQPRCDESLHASSWGYPANRAGVPPLLTPSTCAPAPSRGFRPAPTAGGPASIHPPNSVSTRDLAARLNSVEQSRDQIGMGRPVGGVSAMHRRDQHPVHHHADADTLGSRPGPDRPHDVDRHASAQGLALSHPLSGTRLSPIDDSGYGHSASLIRSRP